MAQQYQVEIWGVVERCIELWSLGHRGIAIAGQIMPTVEEWAKLHGEPTPNKSAVGMAVNRYMGKGPVDRRTRRARAMGAVVPAAERAAEVAIQAQVDALSTLQSYVERINSELDKLETLKERDPKTGALFVPHFGAYFTAMTALSKEMRGWLTLLVGIKDRLWQHDQYELALRAILSAIATECPPEVAERIGERLRADANVSAALGKML